MENIALRKGTDCARGDKGLTWITGLMLCIGLMAATKTSEQAGYLTARAVQQTPASAPTRSEVIPPEVTAIAQDIGERFHVSQEMATKITREAFRAADGNKRVKPTLVLAVVAVESSYRPQLINRHSGAKGLMQVLPKWHPEKIRNVGGERALLMVEPNIQVGTAILAEYLSIERGRLDPALARYSGSAQADQYVKRVRDQMRHLSKVAKRATALSGTTLMASRS